MNTEKIEKLLFQEMEDVKGGKDGDEDDKRPVCECTKGAGQGIKGDGICKCEQGAAQKIQPDVVVCICGSVGATGQK